VYKSAVDQVSLPRPMTRKVGGEPVRDSDMLAWASEFLSTVLGEPVAAGASR
jgi:transcription-repair coupling factor (superfamily II helicase)